MLAQSPLQRQQDVVLGLEVVKEGAARDTCFGGDGFERCRLVTLQSEQTDSGRRDAAQGLLPLQFPHAGANARLVVRIAHRAPLEIPALSAI